MQRYTSFESGAEFRQYLIDNGWIREFSGVPERLPVTIGLPLDYMGRRMARVKTGVDTEVWNQRLLGLRPHRARKGDRAHYEKRNQ